MNSKTVYLLTCKTPFDDYGCYVYVIGIFETREEATEMKELHRKFTLETYPDIPSRKLDNMYDIHSVCMGQEYSVPISWLLEDVENRRIPAESEVNQYGLRKKVTNEICLGGFVE